MGSTGRGQTIAFVELGSPEPDLLLTLQDYARASGLPVPSASQYAQVSAGKACAATPDDAQQQAAAGSDPDVEEQMDVEAAYAMAPGARELVVSGLSCGGSDPEVAGAAQRDQRGPRRLRQAPAGVDRVQLLADRARGPGRVGDQHRAR